MSGAPASGPPPSEGAAHPFGAPLDPAILQEPARPPARPLPVGPLLALALPAAAMAAAALAQKALEGPLPEGDAAGRWLELASLIGLPLGAAAGFLREERLPRRLLWVAWSVLSPLLFVGVVLGAIRAAHPVRELLAERPAASCRLTRKVCSAAAFREVCSASGKGARAKERAEEQLGPPLQSLCGGANRDGTCIHRWSYQGPWTPDNWVAPGSMLCSVVVDAQGDALRSAISAGHEVP